MRRLLSALTVAAGVPIVLVVPVLGRPALHPHPVRPHVTAISVPAVAAVARSVEGPVSNPRVAGSPLPSAAAAHPSTSAPVLAQVSVPRAHRFDLVGATWRAGTLDPGAATVQVRVHQAGRWTGWSALAPQDGGADGGSADAARAARVHTTTQAAEPVWVGAADGVQARVVGATGGAVAPSDLKVVLVDGGSSSADGNPVPQPVLGSAVADAATPRPQIYTRADWGADESLRRSACPSGPDYSPTIKMGFVHHTDGGNGYTRSQVPAIIRSIYAYHVRSNGWCDIGYNYLVDKFGRIWEGRYGGITRPVIGAHTGGFNYDSFGVALIGTYSSARPSAAMTTSLEKLFAWRLGHYYDDPLGTATMTAGSFSGSRYRAGSTVTFKTVSGHRDADFTDCPGAAAYGQLPAIRAGIAATMGAGFVAPQISAATTPMAGPPLDVTADVVGAQSWTLTVSDSTGTTVKTYTGTADRNTPVDASWDLTDTSLAPVLPGTYKLRLSGAAASGDTARTWSTTVTVTPPVTLTTPTQAPLDAAIPAQGTGIPGHSVAVSVSTPQGTQPLGTYAVGRDGRWSGGSVTVNADRDLTWSATDPAASGYTASATTKVAPSISTPTAATSFVPAGSPLTVTGTALPAAGPSVTLMTQPPGATTGSTSTVAQATVGSDGTWSASFTPAAPAAFWVVDARGLASGRQLVYPVPAPTGSAPASGYAGRSVTVRGDAGAPVRVTVSSRTAGGQWSVVRTVTASTSGRFHVRLPLPADGAGSAVKWKAGDGYGTPATGAVDVLPVFAPTISGQHSLPWGATRSLTGTAVPGDTVTVWTAPRGTSSWTVAGRVRAASDKTWSLPVRFVRDTKWRAAAPSGTSATGHTVVRPTIHAPATSSPGQVIAVRGHAVPHEDVTVYRRRDGSTAWKVVGVATAAASGRWRLTCHPRHPWSLRALSDRHWSSTIHVAVG